MKRGLVILCNIFLLTGYQCRTEGAVMHALLSEKRKILFAVVMLMTIPNKQPVLQGQN